MLHAAESELREGGGIFDVTKWYVFCIGMCTCTRTCLAAEMAVAYTGSLITVSVWFLDSCKPVHVPGLRVQPVSIERHLDYCLFSH